MRKKFLLSHQIENAEQLLGRLMRGAGMSQDREGWANRLIGMGDYSAAEQIKEAAPSIAVSDVPGFREPFSVLFQQLQNASVFDSILDDVIQAPLKSQIFTGSPFALFEISEGRAIPFFSTAFEDIGELLPVTVGGLVGFTNEYLRSMTPEVDDSLNRAFLNAIAAATDRALIRRLIENAGTSTPATNDFGADIKNAAQDILNGDAGKLHLVVSPQTAIEMGFATNTDRTFLFSGFDINTGGIVGGLPVHVSDQMEIDSSGARALIFDASRIAANRGSVNIERSQSATVQMSDSPTNGPAQVVSAYQTNSTIIRVLRTFGLKVPDNETIAVEFSGVVNWFGED